MTFSPYMRQLVEQMIAVADRSGARESNTSNQRPVCGQAASEVREGGKVIQGKRIAGDVEPHLLQEGEYGYWEAGGGFYARPPGYAFAANLCSHQVTEHEDGTITVSPSILINAGHPPSWHGYLQRGIWTVCP